MTSRSGKDIPVAPSGPTPLSVARRAAFVHRTSAPGAPLSQALAFDLGAFARRVDARLKAILERRQPALRAGELLSISLATPELAGLEPRALTRHGIYWARPGGGEMRFGLGRAASLEASAHHGVPGLERDFAALCTRWRADDVDTLGLPARAFVAIPFTPGGECQLGWTSTVKGRLVVPALTLERRASRCGLTFSHRFTADGDVDAVRARWRGLLGDLFDALGDEGMAAGQAGSLIRVDTVPDDAAWLGRVERALAAIREGCFDKVVLARRIRVVAAGRFEPMALLRRLASRHPACVHFAVAGRAGSLVGVSPERLLALHGNKLVTDAVAGTVERHHDAERDRRLAEALMGSGKARHEQRLVVDDAVRALKPLCTSLNTPAEPQVKRLPRVQHLWSPVHGRIRDGVSALRVATALHPTPAVGGAPRDAALAWLRQQEPEPRGWYSGALGWLDAEGGELSVILRCAVLRERQADLYAGAGIVAGSDPQAELAETEWKFRTILDVLGRAHPAG